MAITEVGHTSAPSSPTFESVDGRCWAKKVSLTAGDLILAVEFYGRYGTPGDTTALGVFVMTDNSAVPGRVIGGSDGLRNLVMTTSLGTNGAERWFQCPVGVPIESTGDYWVGFQVGQVGSASGDWDAAYEGAGNDYRWYPGGQQFVDYDHTDVSSNTNTGNDYLIRAVILS